MLFLFRSVAVLILIELYSLQYLAKKYELSPSSFTTHHFMGCSAQKL